MAVDVSGEVRTGTIATIASGIEDLHQEFGDVYGTGQMPLLTTAEGYYWPGLQRAPQSGNLRTEVFLRIAQDEPDTWRADMVSRLVDLSDSNAAPVLVGVAAAYFAIRGNEIGVRNRDYYPPHGIRAPRLIRSPRAVRRDVQVAETIARFSVEELNDVVTRRAGELDVANLSVRRTAITAPRSGRWAMLLTGLHQDHPAWRN